MDSDIPIMDFSVIYLIISDILVITIHEILVYHWYKLQEKKHG